MLLYSTHLYPGSTGLHNFLSLPVQPNFLSLCSTMLFLCIHLCHVTYIEHLFNPVSAAFHQRMHTFERIPEDVLKAGRENATFGIDWSGLHVTMDDLLTFCKGAKQALLQQIRRVSDCCVEHIVNLAHMVRWHHVACRQPNKEQAFEPPVSCTVLYVIPNSSFRETWRLL